METECRDISKRFKNEYKKYRFGLDIEYRLKNLASHLLRFFDMTLNTRHLPGLFASYKNLMDRMPRTTVMEISMLIQEIEDNIIWLTVASLGIPPHIYDNHLKMARDNCPTKSLDSILPAFLTYIYIYEFQIPSGATQISFPDFWSNITRYLDLVQIQKNFFIKAVAKKALCSQRDVNDNKCLVDTEKIWYFMELIFGRIKNYKFYSKISKICSQYFQEGERYPERIRIVPTTFNSAYKGNQTLSSNNPYIAGAYGLNTPNSRQDGLIIFGRHFHSDICFPEDDKSTDLVSLILYNYNDNYYAIDCSTKGYCGMLLYKGIKLKVNQGMLINLAKNISFKVEEFNYNYENPDDAAGDDPTTYLDQDNLMIVQSTLTLKCFEGTYKDQTFRLNTKTRTQARIMTHMLGCGGGGEAPNLFIPKEVGVSRKHCEFKFLENECLWVLEDEKSTNGTFILFKNLQEYQYKENSKLIPIFPQKNADPLTKVSNESDCTLLISKYTFFISKIGSE
jgi:FHA domain